MTTREKTLLLALNALIHAIVLLDYWLSVLPTELPASWSYQYTVALLITLLCASVNPFARSKRIVYTLLAVRLTIACILAIPYANRLGGFGLIFALLAFEAFIYLPTTTAALFSVGSILAATWAAYQQPHLWGQSPGPFQPSILAIMWGQWILSTSIGYNLVRERRLRIAQAASHHELLTSNQYLRDTNIQLQDIAAHTEVETVFKERKRIAREIHDSVAHTLTNLIAILNVYRERFLSEGSEAPEELNQARVLAQEGLVDIRQILYHLRPTDDQKNRGLVRVYRLAKVFGQATGIDVIVNYGGIAPLVDQNIVEVFYRAAQEAFTNAFRHGKATHISVSFQNANKGITLSVRDNGAGTTSTSGGGYGLIGIRERVSEVGGTVETSSKPGGGFLLRVWIPLASEGSETDAVARSG